MYSQNDEEKVIVDFFGSKIGRFLDIGAYDGVTLSNTRKLLELGWSGVMVEPDPRSFWDLINSCRQFDKATFVNSAVSACSEIRKMTIECCKTRTWATSINSDLVEKGMVVEPFPGKIFVKTIGTVELFEGFGPVDFLSLDAEWEDDAILREIPAKTLKSIQLICVECRNNDHRSVLKQFATEHQFKVHHETPENLIIANRL